MNLGTFVITKKSFIKSGEFTLTNVSRYPHLYVAPGKYLDQGESIKTWDASILSNKWLVGLIRSGVIKIKPI